MESLDRLRVDTVGSLLRPDALKDAFGQHERGRISDEHLHETQDVSIASAIAKQDTMGMPIVSDGEFRRRHFNESFADVSGFVGGDLAPIAPSRFTDAASSTTTGQTAATTVRRAVAEPIRLVRNRSLDGFRFAQSLTSAPVKATLINPDGIAQRFDQAGTPTNVYRDTEAFLADVVRVEREIISGLIAAGCRYIQIDAPRYGAYFDERWRAEMRSRGRDPEQDLQRAIAAENSLIEGFPRDVTFGLHICRGNRRSQWHFEGSYEQIATGLCKLGHSRILLEYDTERAGGFESLERLPEDSVAVLGLISSKSAQVECADDLKRRIDTASRFIALDRLALSPQCGFATALEGNLLTEDAQWRKLALMLEVAEDVWGRG